MTKIDWPTWVTILLAAIGVLIAALGVLFTVASVVLAGLAIFGFRDLKTTVIAQAAEAAKIAADKAISDVVSKYPSPAAMFNQIKADVLTRIPDPQFASKFDVEASETRVSSEDSPPLTIASGRVTDVYPEEAEAAVEDKPLRSEND